jgi:hypothetical protein
MMTQFTLMLNYKWVFLIPIFRHRKTRALGDLFFSAASLVQDSYLRVVRYSTTSRNSDGASVLARFSGMLLCLVSAI